jgi:ribosomal protein S18 acetylase RimI-like enzyme
MDLEVRDARPDDLPALIAMLVDDSIGRQYESASDEARAGYAAAFDAILASDANDLIVAVSGGAVVGMLQITYSPGLNRRGSWRATIESVRVRRDRQRKGIGAALMHTAIERAQQRGCGIVQLTAHSSRAGARRFYESLGFAGTHVGMKLTISRQRPGR